MLVPLELAQGQNIQQTIAMQPLGTGTTDVTFSILMPEGEPQPAGGTVSVLVDGTPVQSLAASVPTGLHVFQAELEGYNSLPETVLVDVPGAFSQQLALLSPETSQISLTLAGDIPGTAAFYVDGVQITTGRRLTHIADRGSHTVRVTMEGRDDWSRTIDLGTDGFSQTVVLEETVTTGRLLIGPEPWADVTINGTGYGQTPMPPIELEPGSYTVRLSNPDYEDQIQTVTITLGEDTSIRYTAEQRAPDQPEIIEEQPVIPPFPTQQVSPQVPGLAAERGDIHGYVTLEVRVGTDGSVLGVTVTNDPLGLGCGQAAADAVSQWRFQPATQGGVPVEVTTAVQVRFDIQ
jgi:protein TonB